MTSAASACPSPVEANPVHRGVTSVDTFTPFD